MNPNMFNTNKCYKKYTSNEMLNSTTEKGDLYRTQNILDPSLAKP